MSAPAQWITEADVAALVDLGAAAATITEALVLEHGQRASTLPKTAVAWGAGHTLHALGGVIDEPPGDGVTGTKTWAHTYGGATPLLVLWATGTGDLLAVVEAFALGQLRTAAVSAIATDHLARSDAAVMAMVGTGRQALAQVAAVAGVRGLDEVRVFSPTAQHRERFATLVREAGAAARVTVCDSVPAAVEAADVVTTATRAGEPFLHAADLTPGAHVNALGAITPERRELAGDVAARAALVVSDSPGAALELSTELGDRAVTPLSAVVAGVTPRRRPSDVTLFKAMGLGLADVALGAEVLRRAVAAGCGSPLPAPERAAPMLFPLPTNPGGNQ